ncbi:IS200/IS605 family transposase [Micromonospora viridifaciens]|uniref:IS200/IS605 family transposase n=1 Tax=Micromonospora viridifaciens TaxID=1881 RepID=UPI001E610B0C|nr:IS200/IS605 family transposase [Micromonospora viridifaciens]
MPPRGQAISLLRGGVQPVPPARIRRHGLHRTLVRVATDYPVRTGRHCAFLLHAHLVFVTKYRACVFTDGHLRYLEQVMRQVCEQFECKLVEFNGADNHVYLLVNFPRKAALP